MFEFLVVAYSEWSMEGQRYEARVVRSSDAYNAASMSGFSLSAIVRIERLP